MKKIITSLMLTLLLIPLVYSQIEITSNSATVISPESIERPLSWFEKLMKQFTVGTIIVSEPSGTIGVCKTTATSGINVFSKMYPQTEIINTGTKCSANSLIRVYECQDGNICNNRIKVVEAYRINSVSPRLTQWNPNKYYGYLCYDCAGQTTTPTPTPTPTPTEKTFRGFCLDSHNICRYIDRTYTEQQQILSTYQSYDCIKPLFPNLYSIQSECESNRQKQITCYTDCINGKYETKIVTATFCSDAGLKSIPPSNCISPTAKPCSYNGETYQPNDLFCYGDNIVKCVDNLQLATIKNCQYGCKDGQCVTLPSKEKVCCRTYEFWKQENAGYSYELQEKCIVGLNVKEVDLSYCTGEKEPEEPPEVDEETEEGSPDETEGVDKCSLSLGAYCKPDNQAGLDDSSPNDMCKSGWCQDVTGVGGRCAKVGTFSDGKVQSGYESHPDCVESAKTYETNWCGWTTWSPEWLGTQCQTGYGIVIGGIILLFLLIQLGGKKQ